MVLLVTLAGPGWLPAQEVTVSAQFADGNSGADADAYPGHQGAGWSGAWQVILPSRDVDEHFTIGTSETTPLPNSTQRLELRAHGSQPMVRIARSLDEGVIDTSKPYSISFQVRLDTLNFPIENFNFVFSGQNQGGSFGPSQSTWFVMIQNGAWQAVSAGEGGALEWDRLSIPLAAEVVFTLVVDVDPGSGTYRFSVSDGIDQLESEELKSPVPNSGVAELVFAGGNGKPNEDGFEDFVWSLANVEVRGSK